jgi:hypothetical protein
MGSKIRPRAADGLQCLPAGIPTTRIKIKKSPYVSIFGPSSQPINQTLDLSKPNPTFVPTRSPLTPSHFSRTGGGASGAHLLRRRQLQARRGTRRSSVLRISSRSWSAGRPSLGAGAARSPASRACDAPAGRPSLVQHSRAGASTARRRPSPQPASPQRHCRRPSPQPARPQRHCSSIVQDCKQQQPTCLLNPHLICSSILI